jgi:tricarballylate dehydrogenase
MSDGYDLVVVGCGAAGLATAVSFLEESERNGRDGRIAVVEVAAREERGGATRWTNANLRLTSDERLDPTWVSTVQELSGGLADLAYCQMLEREVPATVEFLRDHKVEVLHRELVGATFAWGTSEAGPPNVAYPNGGGHAIVDAFAARVEEFSGAEILYQTEAVRLSVTDEGRVDGVVVRGQDGLLRTLRAENVMLASGGFEGNPEMLTRYLGLPACDLKLIAPGVGFNRGQGITMAMDIGAGTAGQFDMIHSEAVDARTQRADAVIYAHTAGIVVNQDSDRFFDEGQGGVDEEMEMLAFEIFKSQDQTAFFIFDQTIADKTVTMWFDTDKEPLKANTIEDLAGLLGLEPEKLRATVDEFNAACSDDAFDLEVFDGKHTKGLVPPKSNWANPIDSPPYFAYPLTTAITFTYGGLKVDTSARVLTDYGVPIPGLHAAGEITGLFYHEYPGAVSVLRSLTFGRLAGTRLAKESVTSTSPADGGQ